jgi:hypothetical protein
MQVCVLPLVKLYVEACIGIIAGVAMLAFDCSICQHFHFAKGEKARLRTSFTSNTSLVLHQYFAVLQLYFLRTSLYFPCTPLYFLGTSLVLRDTSLVLHPTSLVLHSCFTHTSPYFKIFLK